ncbi:MAG: hypothetical protein G3M70_11295 [Candidatus Nitronauta litoralis]|uniref:Uncharacterized protein n=1 Tax=Candidatus Nitronauta litoralis TaxID=2705533 RepID=A0A7T0BWY9_9BACT|nr:MAG: hypothetical protein G3M70_11295 [Candidatus Nitronauta litoralis]
MKKTKTFLISTTAFLFLFGEALTQAPSINVSSTFSENLAWAGEQVEISTGTDVKSWESFRGWSPRVPYGSSSNPSRSTATQSENLKAEKETKTSKQENDGAVKRENSTSSPIIRDDVKPWESFRGWSREVPYNRNY